MSALPATVNDRSVWDVWLSAYHMPVVTVADEVGTFKALSAKAMTSEELAAEIGVDARARLNGFGIRLAASVQFCPREYE